MREQDQVWWVMTHLNPGLIEKILQKENQGGFLKDGEALQPPVTFFIPFQFIKHRVTAPTTKSEISMDNGIREALHSYVFIKAGEERIRQIVESDWNRLGRLHLYHVRDKSGGNLWVSDEEIQPFFETIKGRQLKFFVGQPVRSMGVGDSVIIQLAPWTGKKGIITGITFHESRISMSVSVELFGSLTCINFTDIHDGDVVFEDPEKEILFSGNLVDNFESEMVYILGRSDDLKRIKRLYAYRDITVDGEEEHRRFTAVMLICAHLLKDIDSRASYLQQVCEWLGPAVTDITSPANATEAILMIALFVVTHDPRLRDAVKQYRHSHPDCPAIVHRLFAKVKRLRVRK